MGRPGARSPPTDLGYHRTHGRARRRTMAHRRGVGDRGAPQSRGCYQDALEAAEQGGQYVAELGQASWSLVELIEAAARSGRPERAADAMKLLSEAARATGTDWALG